MLKPLAAALLLIATPATAAEEQLVPTWMTVDAGAHKVTGRGRRINRNNSNRNFNGYYDGDIWKNGTHAWNSGLHMRTPSMTTTLTATDKTTRRMFFIARPLTMIPRPPPGREAWEAQRGGTHPDARRVKCKYCKPPGLPPPASP